MDIINFNHVSPDLDEETLKFIEDLMIYYHQLSWCHKKNYTIYNIKEEICTYGRIVLITTGTIVGGVTLNAIIFTVTDSVGAALIAFSVKGKFAQKADRAKTAHIEFEKMINELKSYRRGITFNREKFIENTNIIEDFLIEEAPIKRDWIVKKYKKEILFISLIR